MKKAAPAFTALLLLSGSALAQPKPTAPAPPASAPAPPGAPGGTPSTAAPASAPDPTVPDVSDPMLEPPPAPAHVLTSFREALSMVKSSSTSLRSALARIEQARARARQASAGWKPTLDLGARAQYEIIHGRRRFTVDDPADTTFPASQIPASEKVPDPRAGAGATLTARMPLFAPRTWYDSGTAQQAIDVAALDEREVKRQVVATVADAIVVAVTAERLAEVSRSSLRSALSTVDLNRRRAALGASSNLDVLRADGEVQLARAQVVAADEQLMRARESLGFALGATDGWGVTPSIKLDALSNDAKTSCRVERDIATRPDVKAATAKIALAEREVGAVDRTYLPRLDAYSEFGAYPVRSPLNNNFVTWNIGAVLSWNLYDGGARYGQKAEAEASIRLARETATETQRRAQLEVNQSLRGVKVAEANLAVSTRAREIAAETARLAKVSYINGSGTSFDLVDTARRLRDAELDLAVKEFDVIRARIAALLALSSCNL
jgi:multidrug efflux system outer membrane protein